MIRRPTTPLDTEVIQGNILRSYKHDHAGYLFLSIPEGGAPQGRAFLGELVPSVTAEKIPHAAKPPPVTLNVAVTCPGLVALGVPEEPYVESFSEAFRQGLARRFPGYGRTQWHPEFLRDQRHLLLMVHASNPDRRDVRIDQLRRHAAEQGLGVDHYQAADVIKTPPGRKNLREHFGFADGLSQPAVRHSVLRRRPQGGPRGAKRARTWLQGAWLPLQPGEFILGYEDDDGVLPEAPVPPLGDNGTYMVYLRMHQDVALFRTFLREAAAAHDMPEDLVAAKIVGRWQDGTPLVTSADGPLGLEGPALNDFRYGADPDGYACPIGAHIRRTNPRDALGWEDRRSRRHRIIRRGMPYGSPLPDGQTADDGAERGLIFICFNASLERQFETVQRDWLDDGNLFGLGDEQDFLLAPHDGTASMTVQGPRPVFLAAPGRPFVTLQGGDYLFVPGIDALRALAAGFPS